MGHTQKSPAFQFYAGDWLASTRGMSSAARGAYIDLLACAWLEDGLPADPDLLRRRATISTREWRSVWEELAPKFPVAEDGKRRNGRQERVRTAQVMYRRRASDGGKARANGVLKGCFPPAKAPAKEPANRVLKGCTPSPSLEISSKNEEISPPPPPRGFEEFWQAYPRKVGKAAARKAWTRLKPPVALVGVILAAVAHQRQQVQWVRDGGQFVPHPATWLNRGQWDDAVDDADRESGTPGEWVCLHEPHCTGRWRCEQRSQLDAARAAV